MSKKYFLFSGLTLALIIGIHQFIIISYSIINSSTNTDSYIYLIEGLIVLGLCIPSLILTIKDFKIGRQNKVPSILLLIATIIIFIANIYNLRIFYEAMVSPYGSSFLLFFVSYVLGQLFIALIPLTIAVLSFVNFKKREEQYVPSTKLSNIFYYIVLAIVFQGLVTFFTAGMTGIALVASGQTLSNFSEIILYIIFSLAILGLITPSFILSFFSKKKSISRILLTIAAGIYVVLITISTFEDLSNRMGVSGILIESIRCVIETCVIITSIVLMFTKANPKQNDNSIKELE